MKKHEFLNEAVPYCLISDNKNINENELCFVIMSFSGNEFLQELYENNIKPTVLKLGYRCERVDEQDFNGKIIEKILINIKKAKFVIAELTDSKPNCYYELGVAHSIDKEVIHIVKKGTIIPFDVNQYNFIIYSRMDELSKKLEKRIIGTLQVSK